MVAIAAVGRINASIEVEVVGAVGIGAGPRRPAITVLTSVAEGVAWSDKPAPHKE